MIDFVIYLVFGLFGLLLPTSKASFGLNLRQDNKKTRQRDNKTTMVVVEKWGCMPDTQPRNSRKCWRTLNWLFALLFSTFSTLFDEIWSIFSCINPLRPEWWTTCSPWHGYGVYSFNFHQNFSNFFLMKAVWFQLSPNFFWEVEVARSRP